MEDNTATPLLNIDEQRQLFMKEYSSGKTSGEIGKKYKLTSKEVQKILLSGKIAEWHRCRNAHLQSFEAGKIKKFMRFTKKLGRVPSRTEIKNYDSTLLRLYVKASSMAVEQGYINDNIKWIITKQDTEKALDHLVTLAGQLGRTPTVDDVAIDGRFHLSTYYKYFTTFGKALTLAGLSSSGKNKSRSSAEATPENCLEDIRNLMSELGHFPSLHEMRKHAQFPVRCYFELCGSLKEMKAMLES